MPRFFDRTDDRIALALGNAQAMTGMTTAALVKMNADGGAVSRSIFFSGTFSGQRFGLGIDTSNRVSLGINATLRNSTSTVLAADGWCFVATTKASGTSTPRAHIYKIAAGTWVHEAMSGTAGDTTGAGSTGQLIGAANAATPSQFFGGDIDAVGVWETGTAPSDAATEQLGPSLLPWYDRIPNNRGLWLLDQVSTSIAVGDHTRQGADQTAITGTTISTTAPPFVYGRPIEQYVPSFAALARAGSW